MKNTLVYPPALTASDRLYVATSRILSNHLKITLVIIGEWSAGARAGPVCLTPCIETVQFKDFVQHVWKKEA